MFAGSSGLSTAAILVGLPHSMSQSLLKEAGGAPALVLCWVIHAASLIPHPGHVFNMPHDNVKACEEVFGRLKTNHMMSPTLIQIDRANPWSACSAAIITDFLDSGHGESCCAPHPLPVSLCPRNRVQPCRWLGKDGWL